MSVTTPSQRLGCAKTGRPVIRDGLVLETRAETDRYGIPDIIGLFGRYSESASGEHALRSATGELVADLAATEIAPRMQMPCVPTDVHA